MDGWQDRDSAKPERYLKRILWLLPVAVVLGAIWWAAKERTSLPEVRFAKPLHETLISNLPTNAKVEPIDWAPVRVEAPGLVTKLSAKLGDTVAKGALIAMVSDAGLAEQLKAADARTAQIQAEIDTLGKGGRSSELTDIENQLARAKFEHDTENREYGSLKRLYEKQAATMVEMETAHLKVRASEIEMESLERRRKALVSKDDLAGARARLDEAKAARQGVQIRMAQGAIRAPMAGAVYNLPARLGSYLNAGDLVANVGRLEELRIRVYVDEPELGRVAVGQPVKITWDALPGKSWPGQVERMPTEIVPLGTRQVGEVLCTIENSQRELVPGTNVNAEIQTSVVQGALTIPKETLHYENGRITVFVLEGENTVRARVVKQGSTSVTRAQITDGLRDDFWVALPSESFLHDGEKVKVVRVQ